MPGKTALRIGLLGFLVALAGVAWAAMRLEVGTTYVVTLDKNVILADTPFIRIFDVHEQLSVTTDASDDSADIDILLRRGEPLDESTVGALYGSATAVADGPGGDMELVLTRDGSPKLTTGRWYLQLINRSGPETEVEFRVEADKESGDAPGTAKVNPLPGMWYNPARNGHGLDIQIAGEQLFATWFTYDETGLPVWYLASGPFDGARWEAELLRFTSLGTKADGKLETASATVGTAQLEFLDSRNAQLSYEIEGTAGAEPLTPLIVADTPPVENLTGHYFSRNDPGWGYTLNTQGRQVFTVLYYYDNEGRPRWVLGSMKRPLVAKGPEIEFEMEVQQFYGGPSPGGLNTAPNTLPAGTITVSEDRIKTDVRNDKPLAEWLRDQAAAALSDDPPPYVFGQIQGPDFLTINSLANYAAKVDTDAPMSELSYTWNRFGATISSGIETGPSASLRTGSETGLATLQLAIKHEPSGVSAFVTKNVSVQESDGVFDASIQGDPRPPGGLLNLYTAQVFGGQPPYRFKWTWPSKSTETTQPSVAIGFPSPVGNAPKEFPLLLEVTDNRGDKANASLTIAPRIYERPDLRVIGPSVVDTRQLATFIVEPEIPGFKDFVSWKVGGTPDEHGRMIESGCQDGDKSCRVRWTGGSHVIQVNMTVFNEDNLREQISASKTVAVDQGLVSATFVESPLQLEVGQSGTFLIDINGGQPPFDVVFDFDGDGLGDDGFTTRRRQIMRTHSYGRAGEFTYTARVTDSNLQSSPIGGLVRVGSDGTEPEDNFRVDLLSGNEVDFCAGTLIADIDGGEPPFDYLWEFGDGATLNGMTSDRRFSVEHTYPPDFSQSYALRLTVTDDEGARDTTNETISHNGRSKTISVRLFNNGEDNIHIYDRSTSPGSWFGPFTRISRGRSRTESVGVGADECSTSVTWGAGRQQQQFEQVTCSYKKSGSDYEVEFFEQTVGLETATDLKCLTGS